MTLAVGMLLVWFGYAAANGVNGEYWELSGLSKRYPMMILPLAGSIITLASLVNIVEDVIAIRRKTYRLRFLDHAAVAEDELIG
jgi:TRAP-type C4-dicarboxylate transport system permease small subunit